jgi:ubiquinone/menaquinone biosynthesis C-methylase UbiE
MVFNMSKSEQNEAQLLQRLGRSVEQIEARLRPEPWEDDLSRNTLDTAPFANLPPVSERSDEEFSQQARAVTPELLQGADLRTLAARDPWPIPVPEDREGYSPGLDVQYWASGLADYLKVSQAARQLGVEIQRYFDFGCASGRVLRHFAAQTEITEAWGSDINQRHIRWLYEHLPQQVKPIFNHTIPTLPIPDNYFDVITAFSVFTHIDTFETAWLAELRRVLRPGGMAYLTVHNEATWEILRGELENPNNRLVQAILKVDPNFATAVHGPLPDCRTVYRHQKQGPYRAQVFHSNNYLRNVWGRFFEVVEILPKHHVRQTVMLLRKP